MSAICLMRMTGDHSENWCDTSLGCKEEKGQVADTSTFMGNMSIVGSEGVSGTGENGYSALRGRGEALVYYISEVISFDIYAF